MSQRLLTVTAGLVLICLAIVLPAETARAADDDTNSSVYLVFDPETGEFVTMQDPNPSRRNHGLPGNDTATPVSPTSGAESEGIPLTILIASAIAAGLLGAAVFWSQRRRSKPT